jgi:hypothetical protein
VGEPRRRGAVRGAAGLPRHVMPLAPIRPRAHALCARQPVLCV